jgi:hypothetical protein
MRGIVAAMAAAGLLTSGVGTVAVVTAAPHHAPTARALTCAQPVDPTVRKVVNAVCSIFGP